MKNIKYILIALVCSMMFYSCYEDKSTSGSVVNTVKIDTTGWNFQNGVLYTTIGAKIELEPNVTREDGSSDGLEYLWEMPISTAPTSLRTILGESKKMTFTINRKPSTVSYPLFLTVTDTHTGIKHLAYYPVQISSPMGMGIMVADSKDNGVTSDITFVKNKYVTSQYDGATNYVRDAYSVINGQKIKGNVKNITYNYFAPNYQPTYNIHILTDQTFERVATDTYQVESNYESLFLVTPLYGLPDDASIGMANGAFYATMNGDLYVIVQQGLNPKLQFGDPVNYKSGSAIANKIICSNMIASNSGTDPSFIDPTRGEMHVVSKVWSDNFQSIVKVTKGSSSSSFDPSLLANYTPIAVVQGSQDEVGAYNYNYHLLKDPNGIYGLYGVKEYYDKVLEVVISETMDVRSAAGCTEIQNAKYFTNCLSRPVMYYATDTKVYAGIIGNTSVGASPVFTAASGETITCIKVYREAWSEYRSTPPTDSYVTIDTHDNTLLVATVNTAGEGKVYMMPIQGASGVLGEATPDRILSGFGRISVIATQGAE